MVKKSTSLKPLKKAAARKVLAVPAAAKLSPARAQGLQLPAGPGPSATTAALSRLVAQQSGVDAKTARLVLDTVAKNLAGAASAATVQALATAPSPVQMVSAAQVGHYRVFGTTLKPKHLTAEQIAKAVESAG